MHKPICTLVISIETTCSYSNLQSSYIGLLFIFKRSRLYMGESSNELKEFKF